ncbi:carboxypeptidase-like regulatory domain-containing protein [Corynebacterium sp. HS2168-gen11]|uniref:carboxypeptidase-like regulatory domain-containing protein n=1 Tax=Corynebacterium sp. HS2168-gen11 TaxID=2974027 RepID=UPI00216B524C|nr:carboxypeptidase-like regulatory domain-containing protein [Corynebacterium sp. HS2168-gen11]MCS4535337.1 carboxypeptidase-like regulatory domain-containing protein [Corynebacterium sp. HS2168-gen11]
MKNNTMKRVIAVALVPVLGSSVLVDTAFAQDVQVTSPMHCALSRGTDSKVPSSIEGAYNDSAAFPVNITYTVAAPEKAKVGRTFNYTVKNATVSIPKHYEFAGGFFSTAYSFDVNSVSHARVSVPFDAAHASYTDATYGGDYTGTAGAQRVDFAKESTDATGEVKDLAVAPIQGELAGDTFTVTLPETELHFQATAAGEFAPVAAQGSVSRFSGSLAAPDALFSSVLNLTVTLSGKETADNVLLRCVNTKDLVFPKVTIIDAVPTTITGAFTTPTITVGEAATVTGTLVDQDGIAIANAEVEIAGEDLTAPISVTTDAQGAFTAEITPTTIGPKTYTATVKSTPTVTTNVPLEVRNITKKPTAVEITATPETVTVGEPVTIRAVVSYTEEGDDAPVASVTLTIDGQEQVVALKDGAYEYVYTPTEASEGLQIIGKVNEQITNGTEIVVKEKPKPETSTTATTTPTTTTPTDTDATPNTSEPSKPSEPTTSNTPEPSKPSEPNVPSEPTASVAKIAAKLTQQTDATATLEATVVDANDKPVANQELRFIIAGKEVTLTTDANGVVTYELPRRKEEQTVTVATGDISSEQVKIPALKTQPAANGSSDVLAQIQGGLTLGSSIAKYGSSVLDLGSSRGFNSSDPSIIFKTIATVIGLTSFVGMIFTALNYFGKLRILPPLNR